MANSNPYIDRAIKQVNEFMPTLELRDYKSIKQNHNKANYWRKRDIDEICENGILMNSAKTRHTVQDVTLYI